MKRRKRILIVLFLILSAMAGGQALFAGTAADDLADVYEDTAAFDGGAGSTINVSPQAEADLEESNEEAVELEEVYEEEDEF
jgi:hypothetical protein